MIGVKMSSQKVFDNSDFERFFKISSDMFVVTGKNGLIISVNDAFLRVLGFDENEVVDKPFISFFYAEDISKTISAAEDVDYESLMFDFKLRMKTRRGDLIYCLWKSAPDLKTGYLYSVGRDVTVDHTSQHDLNQLFKVIDEAAIIALTDIHGKIEYVNENFSKISGYSKNELIGKDHRILNSGYHSKGFFREIWNTIKSGKMWSGVIKNRKKSGTPYYVQSYLAPLRDIDNKVNRFMALRFDVTNAINNEAILLEAQRVAKIGNWLFDVLQKKIYWSRQMYEFFPADKESGPPSYEQHLESIHPEDRERFRLTVAQALIDGRPYQLRYRTTLPNGSVLWLHGRGEVQKDNEGRVISLSGTCQDITEQVSAEEEVKAERVKSLQSAKLASLGELSAGIAHEINNPLAIIGATVKLLERYKDNPIKFEETVKNISKSVDRIAKIVSGLKKFSRTSEKKNYQVHSLEKIISEVQTLTSAKSSRYFVEFRVQIQPESVILCDEMEIEQVLINLINNAIDAVKNQTEKWVWIESLMSGDACTLRVSDSGPGIPEDIRGKLFQPFFTTKSVGEGTGLGLSIVKGILDEHRASIEILNQSPHTCFEIKFPSISEAKMRRGEAAKRAS